MSNTNQQVRARQLWGSDVYTQDSDLVAALMHSGFYSISLPACPPTVSGCTLLCRVCETKLGRCRHGPACLASPCITLLCSSSRKDLECSTHQQRSARAANGAAWLHACVSLTARNCMLLMRRWRRSGRWWRSCRRCCTTPALRATRFAPAPGAPPCRATPSRCVSCHCTSVASGKYKSAVPFCQLLHHCGAAAHDAIHHR